MADQDDVLHLIDDTEPASSSTISRKWKIEIKKPDLEDDLLDILKNVTTPGDFFCEGGLQTVLPGIVIDPIGIIPLPVTEYFANLIKEQCKAKRGKKSKAMEGVWQMDSDRLHFTNPKWNPFVEEIVAKEVQVGLGVKDDIVARLSKLVLFEAGSKGDPYITQDDKVFGTLVIQLPSQFTGSELVVKHNGREHKFCATNDRRSSISFEAFYSECDREVTPVYTGYKLVVIYDLLYTGNEAPHPADNTKYIAQLEDLFSQWMGNDTYEFTAEKLVYALKHDYDNPTFSLDDLHRCDRAKAEALAKAGKKLGLSVYVGMMTLTQSGWAMQPGYQEDYIFRDSYEVEAEADQLTEMTGKEFTETTIRIDPYVELFPKDTLNQLLNDEPDSTNIDHDDECMEKTYHAATVIVMLPGEEVEPDTDSEVEEVPKKRAKRG